MDRQRFQKLTRRAFQNLCTKLTLVTGFGNGESCSAPIHLRLTINHAGVNCGPPDFSPRIRSDEQTECMRLVTPEPASLADITQSEFHRWSLRERNADKTRGFGKRLCIFQTRYKKPNAQSGRACGPDCIEPAIFIGILQARHIACEKEIPFAISRTINPALRRLHAKSLCSALETRLVLTRHPDFV